ncbi:hypothetical protein KY285_029009 [Solanum tuberosum]|nr:hypothetical protein KY285_029009 [Solanum tuberosum]
MGSKKCQVCDEAQSKYKCPNCFIPFCSLVCFKKHKEIPCGKPEPEPESEPVSEEKLAPAPALHVEKPIYVDEPGEAVNQSQLESIASSSEILEAIRNKELQKLIYNLDSSLDAENELDKAMEKEELRIISEKINCSLQSELRSCFGVSSSFILAIVAHVTQDVRDMMTYKVNDEFTKL